MTELLRKNRVFFLTYLGLFLIVGVFMLLYTKDELMRWVNVRNSLPADYFFNYLTYLGDGLFFVIAAIILVIFNKRIGILAFASFAVSSLISLFLKEIVFHQNVRPLKYFEHSKWEYHVIKGLHIHSYNSFPSGHTTSAFALFTLLALLDTGKDRGWLYVLIAASVGYSRVYLFQHFVEDALAGSIIGVLTSTLLYWWFQRSSVLPGK